MENENENNELEQMTDEEFTIENLQKRVEEKFTEYVDTFAGGNNFYRKFVNYIFKDGNGMPYPKSKERKVKLEAFLKSIRRSSEDGELLFDNDYILRNCVRMGDTDYVIQIEHRPDNMWYRIAMSPSLDRILLQRINLPALSENKEVLNVDKTASTSYIPEMLQFIFRDKVDDADDIWIPEEYIRLFEDEHTKLCEEKYDNFRTALQEKEDIEEFNAI